MEHTNQGDHMNCETCHQPAKRNESVLRGNGHHVRRWHRECWAYKLLKVA